MCFVKLETEKQLHNVSRICQYVAKLCPIPLEYHINQDINNLTHWFIVNFLEVDAPKTQAIVMRKSKHNYDMSIGATNINIEPTLKILGVTLDCNFPLNNMPAARSRRSTLKLQLICSELDDWFPAQTH